MIGVGRLAEAFRVICRQLVRNPRRTIITFLGLVVSFFLYTLLKGSLDTMNRDLSERVSGSILAVAPRAALGVGVAQLPRSYASELRDLQGVMAVSPVRLFVGRGRGEGSSVLALGVEWDSFFEIRPLQGITPEERALAESSRAGALIGRSVLDENGWKVGDKIAVRTGTKGPVLPISVAGDIEDDSYSAVALVDLDYLNDVISGGGRASFIQVKVARPELAASLGRLIDARFANYSVPTETKSEKAYLANVLAGFSELLGAFEAICYLTLAVTVLVVANSVAMSVRERTVEIGTLRALGFSKLWIIGLILGEAVLVSILGGIVGGVSALGFASIVNAGYLTPEGQPVPRLLLDAESLLRTSSFAILVGGLASIQPVLRAVRMPIASALRFAM